MAQQGEQYTIILLEGRTPKRCIGIFQSVKEAQDWAKADGWEPELFKVVPFVR